MEISRLAKGYVRQELRPLKKLNSGDFEIQVTKLIKARVIPFFAKGKRLPESEPKKIIEKLERDILPMIHPIGKMPEFLEFKQMKVRAAKVNAFYFESNSHKIISMEDQHETFHDNTVDLRFVRATLDRKRFKLDNFSCGVSISEHALHRMSDRGFSPESPLHGVSAELARWYPLTLAFILTGLLTKEPFGLAMPLNGGMMLGSMIGQTCDEQYELTHRRQLLCDVNGMGLHTPKTFDPLKISDSTAVMVRINTYVDHAQLSRQQHWALDKLDDFMQKYHDRLNCLTMLVLEPEMMTMSLANEVKSILIDMVSLVQDPIWEDAIRMPL